VGGGRKTQRYDERGKNMATSAPATVTGRHERHGKSGPVLLVKTNRLRGGKGFTKGLSKTLKTSDM